MLNSFIVLKNEGSKIKSVKKTELFGSRDLTVLCLRLRTYRIEILLVSINTRT